MLLTVNVRHNFVESGIQRDSFFHRRNLTKLLLIMKLTIILTVGISLGAFANGYSQNISLAERNASLVTLFKKN